MQPTPPLRRRHLKVRPHEWDMAAARTVREIRVSPSSDQRAIALDPGDKYFYMTEGDFNLLRKVDLSTGREVGRVQFNSEYIQPAGIIPVGNTGYVVSGSRDIMKMDLTTGRITGTIHVPVAFQGYGYHDGRLYVGSGDRILALEPADGSVIREYPLEWSLNSLTFTFYGDRMAAIDFEQGGMIGKRLILFDATTMAIRRTVDLPHEPHGQKVIVSPDGSKLYMESGPMWGGATTVTVMDSRTLDTLNKITIDPVNVRRGATGFLDGDFDEAHRVLYLLGFTSVYQISMDTDQLVGVLDLIDIYGRQGGAGGWPPTGLASIMLSPARDRLFVVSGDAHSMYTYDLRKGAWTDQKTNVKGYFITGAARSPDGRHLFTANSRSDSITMIDTESNAVAGITYLDGVVGKIAGRNKLVIEIGRPTMFRNGREMEIDPGNGTAPTLVSDRTLLPIRAVVEAMGGKVGWDGGESKVTIRLNYMNIELWIDKDTAVVNGATKKMDVPPRVINSRTMMPLRFVAENLGVDLGWDGKTQTITITY